MKIKIFIVLSLLVLCFAYEYDILDSKTGEPIEAVSNLKHLSCDAEMRCDKEYDQKNNAKK